MVIFEVKNVFNCDVVVTNPPFSLFREYISQLFKYDKKFIILGNKNAITYKEVFSLIKDNKLWLGASIHSGGTDFIIPKSYTISKNIKVDKDGNKLVNIPGPRWFTNVDYKQRYEDIILYKKYLPEEYPKYDNYDAINVDKTSDIPCDYVGVMGVPITFMDKYNPKQFRVVGLLASAGYDASIVGIPFKGKVLACPLIDGKRVYARVLIEYREEYKNENNIE